MSYTVEQLKPANPVLFLDDMGVELSVLTLNHHVRFTEMFGDLKSLYDELRKSPLLIIDICWELVVHKNHFNYSYSEFKKKFFSVKNKLKIGQKAIEEFDNCVVKSMPLVINKKRNDDIRKLNEATGKSSEPCYAKYYDSISKRYGTNLEDFYKLTLRQLTAMLKTIGDESYGELEVQASLAGKKLKPRIEYKEISEEEEKEQDEQAQEALKRLQQAYKERNNGK